MLQMGELNDSGVVRETFNASVKKLDINLKMPQDNALRHFA